MRLKDVLLMVALGTGVLFVISTNAATLSGGDLLKASSGSAVYYFGVDSKRHVFPTEKIFLSWYYNFSEVKTISDTELASIPLGDNVTYRPGIRLIKVATDPRVYAVEGTALRWITSEVIAEAIFGKNWAEQIDDLPDSLFMDYTPGEQIDQVGDYSPTFARNSYVSVQTAIAPPGPMPLPDSTTSTSNTPVTSSTSTDPSVPDDPIPPTAPEDILANALTDQSAFVTWVSSADNEGVSGYAIYRDGVLVGKTSINRFTDMGLSPGTTYSYTVLAFDPSGNKSPFSSSKSVSMPVPDRPSSGSPSYVIANWPLNEGSGSSTANIATGLYTGTLNSTTTWVSGISGNALYFGSPGARVSTGNISEMKGAQQLSLAVWLKRESTASAMYVGDDDSVNEEGVGIAMSGAGNGRIRFHLGNTGITAYGFIDVTGTAWHHYAMVFDGTKSGNAQRLKLYKDGIAQSVGFSGTIPAQTHSNISQFFIGGFGTHGTIDEVRLYNTALTAAEVAALAGL